MKQQTLRTLMIWGVSTLLFTGSLWGQTTPPDINPPEVAAATDVSLTPNITGSNASIGNIYSPNLYDGSANIVVPIYQYQNDYGNYGVSFSYNTKGIKVDEIASPVGLHWQINAGGSISRVMKDAPDELNDFVPLTITGTQTLRSVYLKGKWADIYGPTTPEEGSGGTLEQRIYRDGEFDDFVVSAGNLNFTFNLGKDGYIFTHPNRRVKIEMLVDGAPVTQLPHTNFNGVANYIDLSFHITDEQGTQYWFSKDNSRDWDLWDGKTVTSEKVATYSYNAHWVLDKVVFPNGQALSYTYAPNAVSNVLYGNAVSMERVDAHYVNTVSNESAGSSISGVSAIHYPNGVSVDFIYGTGRCDGGGQILRSVKVSAGDNSINYVMQQKYTTAPDATYTAPVEVPLGNCNVYNNPTNVIIEPYRYLRLRLKGIRIQSDDGSYSEPYYTFGYESTRLPARLTASQDYFGYYNGKVIPDIAEEKKTVPYHTPLLGTGGPYGIDRLYNASKAKAGLLTRVTNAYGGSDSFVYEAHQLLMLSGMPVPANDPLFFGNQPDGVRLKSVIEQDPYHPGNYSQTNFTYSNGQYFIPGGYFHYPRAMSSGTNPGVNSWYFTGIYVSPHQFVNGSNHGYSGVTAETRDQAGNLLGRKVTTFTNLLDASSGNQLRYHLAGDSKNYYQYPFANRQYLKDWELGLPLEIKSYDQNNRIVSDVINTYTFNTDDNSSAGKVENKAVFRVPQSPASNADSTWYRRFYKLDSAFYHPYTGTALLSNTITRKYVSDNSYVADTVSFQYDSHHNLLSTTATNSKGEKTVLRNVYNYMVGGSEALPDSQPTSATINNMSNAGLEKIVSMERWKVVGSGGISDKLLDASITQYQYQDGKLFTKGLYKYSTGSPVLRSGYQGFSNPNSSFGNPYKKNIVAAYNNSAAPAAYYREVSKVTAFDDKGNPLETQLLGMDQYKAMLWDTMGNKIAEAVNARSTDIAGTSFEGGAITGTSQLDGNFIYSTANIISGSAVTGKKYLKLSGPQGLMCSVATPNQQYTVTFWCKGGLPVINGAGFSSVALTNTYSLASGWKFYTGVFTPTSASVVFFSASATIYIDEARVFPTGAQMQSWTYEPLFGKSSATDARGRITYYDYDVLGRPQSVRDQDGNIKQYTISRIAN